jgi:hypothetical protein
MALTRFLTFRWVGVPCTPRPEERPFLARAQVQQDDDLVVRVAVLDDRESDRFFGVPLAHRGIQPVWPEIHNRGKGHYQLRLASMDPNYYPPLEAAFINHFRIGRRLLEFGMLAWFFLPLLILLPVKLLGAQAANRRMNAFFVQQGIGSSLIRPGHERAGFVFTVGAIGGHFADYGIGRDFIEQVRGKVREGTSALFLLLGPMTADRVVEAFRAAPKFEIIASNLSNEQEAKLKEAFAS